MFDIKLVGRTTSIGIEPPQHGHVFLTLHPTSSESDVVLDTVEPRLPVISMWFGGAATSRGDIFLRMVLAGLGLTMKTREKPGSPNERPKQQPSVSPN